MDLRSNFEPGTTRWAVRRTQWKSMGISEEDMEKPKIAVINTSNKLSSCFAHVDKISQAVQNAIKAHGGVTGIIAVLQRCTHVFHFVLMPGDLCQEASACTNNSHGNDHEFLYCWMGKSCNVFYSFLTVGLMVKVHQICHALDCMTVLCEPGCKDHILFCFPDSIAV